MSEIWATSDTHAFHANIIKYCNRPFTDEYEMNEQMEDRWNYRVKEDDIVIHLGDVSAGLKGRTHMFREQLAHLNGRKILVRGNHDHLDDSFFLENGFVKVIDNMVHAGVLFTHAPASIDPQYPHPFSERAVAEKAKYNPVLVVHGHVHRNDIPEFEGHFNCAVDRHNFCPITLREVLERSGHAGLVDDVYKSVNEFIIAK